MSEEGKYKVFTILERGAEAEVIGSQHVQVTKEEGLGGQVIFFAEADQHFTVLIRYDGKLVATVGARR